MSNSKAKPSDSTQQWSSPPARTALSLAESHFCVCKDKKKRPRLQMLTMASWLISFSWMEKQTCASRPSSRWMCVRYFVRREKRQVKQITNSSEKKKKWNWGSSTQLRRALKKFCIPRGSMVQPPQQKRETHRAVCIWSNYALYYTAAMINLIQWITKIKLINLDFDFDINLAES